MECMNFWTDWKNGTRTDWGRTEGAGPLKLHVLMNKRVKGGGKAAPQEGGDYKKVFFQVTQPLFPPP